MDIIRNNIAFIATFVFICISTIAIIEAIVYLFNRKHKNDTTNITILIIGVVLALLMTPFYYFPA